ncbi:MAG: anaerobic selenocysteine-containing dehydrogenase, partial [Enterobacterales bacterium]
LADKHFFIKPGTDALLLLAMLNVVFSENLQTLGNLGSHIEGLGKIKELVTDYTPERMSGITGIAAEQVTIMVREFCEAESASCYGRIGVSTQEFGTLAQWLITVFNIVTGNLDVPGGVMFSTPAVDILNKSSAKRKGFADNFTRVRKLPDFSGEFPVATLAEEINTEGQGQIKALVTSAGNPVLSTPNGKQLDSALATLDFMVSIDFYINETTRHADIILPPLSSLERSHYDVIFNIFAIENVTKFSEALFKPNKNQRSDAVIFSELAWRMQSTTLISKVAGWFTKKLIQTIGHEGILNSKLKNGSYGKSHQLSIKKLKQHPHGIHLGPLEPRLPERLFTVDKKIKLAPSECLDDIARLNEYLSKASSTKENNTFDLLLIGRRDPRTNNSWLHNSYRMVKGKERCVALINPEDATQRGVADGDTVQVKSRVGMLDIIASLSDEMMPGVISIPHGWGHDMDGVQLKVAKSRPGVNTNILTDEYFLDGLSGNAALNGVPVSLSLLSTKITEQAVSS